MALILSFLLTASLTVKDCSSGNALFGLDKLSISPVNPNPGDSVTLHMQYTVPSGIILTGGTAKYAINYNFLPLQPVIEPLCENVPCPLGPGVYTNDTVTTWPTDVSGTINTQMTWLDTNSTLLLCVLISGKTR
jgi:hypothetical protein